MSPALQLLIRDAAKEGHLSEQEERELERLLDVIED